jgi:hypothetical protein
MQNARADELNENRRPTEKLGRGNADGMLHKDYSSETPVQISDRLGPNAQLDIGNRLSLYSSDG